MYTNPYGGSETDVFQGLSAVFGCIALFTLLLVVLYLWLFYRIFSKAGYSGWYTLLNLIPYVGSLIVIFMLAFGDWPALRNRTPGYQPPAGGYPPAQPGSHSATPQPPAYQPPAAPAAPAGPAVPAPEPVPTPAPAPAVEPPPAPPAEPAPADEPGPAAPSGDREPEPPAGSAPPAPPA